ncbi:hypothetical protein Dsin_019342 [Dipteronia sinensis]|uniref:At2g29880-like C-terminal domain-containing protein n=1 Tax=Dipteronia sinensis TaxID=43782 RepID=A0AAE0A764_9ROSI|nr:hypothetical protein Dsin_019342 [Dipteronia sinensis]
MEYADLLVRPSTDSGKSYENIEHIGREKWENVRFRTPLPGYEEACFLHLRPLGSMFNKEKTGQRKRSRSEYEGSSSSNRTNNHARVLGNLSVGIDSISTNFERIYNLMETRERDREIEKRTTIWDDLKDIPDLDDNTRFRAIELLNTKTMNDMFFKMTTEERSAWILLNLKLIA